MDKVTPAASSPASSDPHLRRVARPRRAKPPAVSSPQAHTPPPQGRRPPLQPGAVRKRKLEVDASTPTNPIPPPVHRLSTPECVSSPVSHLRNLTKDLDEGARRERAAQYLRETREAHLQQRRLYLVLDLDETLVHALRQTVRPVQPLRPNASAENGGDAPESSQSSSSADGTEQTQVTLTVQNVQFEMMLRPVRAAVAPRARRPCHESHPRRGSRPFLLIAGRA